VLFHGNFVLSVYLQFTACRLTVTALKANLGLLSALVLSASLLPRKVTKIRLVKALVWPVATYDCESWTLKKNEETRLDAFEMKGLRKILRVLWIGKKTNEWVLKKLE